MTPDGSYNASVVGEENVKDAGASRIFQSAFALMLSTVASSALGMLFWVVAARLFETETVGRASAAVAAISLLGGLGQLGLSSVLIRFVPLIGAAVGRFLSRTYLLSATVTLVLAAGFVAFGFGRQFLGHGLFWAAAFCLAVVGLCVSTLQDAVLTALKHASWVPVKNVAMAVGRLALLPALIATAWVDPVFIAWGVPMVAAVVAITLALFGRLLPRHVRQHAGRVRMPSRRELLKFTSAGYADGLLGNLVTYLPPVIITSVLGPAANAVFFVPWLVGTVLYGLLWNISSSFVVEATSDAANTGTHLRHATRLALLVGIGAPVTLVIGAPWLLQLLGSDYASGGATALRLIALSVPFGCITLVYTVSLLIERRNWAIFRLSLLSAVVSVPLWVVGMYRFGISGVAAGILVADGAIALCLLPTVIRRYRALANRSIDDDVTMVVDLATLRADLRLEAAGVQAGGPASAGANDETAVLDLAALQAQLQLHNPGSFTTTLTPHWPSANDQTVVLQKEALLAATPEEAATAVLTRVIEESADTNDAEDDPGTDDDPPSGRHAWRDRPRHVAEVATASPVAAPGEASSAKDGTFGWFAGA